MIDTVKEEDKKKQDETKSEEQAFKEEIKNKNIEDQNHMKLSLEGKSTKYYTDLEQMSQKYTSDTQKRTGEHSAAYEYNLKTEKNINTLNRQIATKKVKIDQYKLKILQHKKECSARNAALKKEKDNISKNYQELKLKMTKFRDEEEKRRKELSNNSRNAVERLKEYEALGEKILKTAELCRRHETEKEKVLPFFEGSVEENEIPEDFKQSFTELTPEEYEEFRYLNNFYKRYNKVLLDRLVRLGLRRPSKSKRKDCRRTTSCSSRCSSSTWTASASMTKCCATPILCWSSTTTLTSASCPSKRKARPPSSRATPSSTTPSTNSAMSPACPSSDHFTIINSLWSLLPTTSTAASLPPKAMISKGLSVCLKAGTTPKPGSCGATASSAASRPTGTA